MYEDRTVNSDVVRSKVIKFLHVSITNYMYATKKFELMRWSPQIFYDQGKVRSYLCVPHCLITFAINGGISYCLGNIIFIYVGFI